MRTIGLDMESQQWTDGLNPCGLYYEGYTDDLQQMLTKHSSATVSTYGYAGHTQIMQSNVLTKKIWIQVHHKIQR